MIAILMSAFFILATISENSPAFSELTWSIVPDRLAQNVDAIGTRFVPWEQKKTFYTGFFQFGNSSKKFFCFID